MDWVCGEGQSYLAQCVAGAQYLSSNRLLISSFIRSLTAHRNSFSRTGCTHVIPVQSQSMLTLHTKVCNTQKCQGILTVLRFDLCPPSKLKQVITVFNSGSKNKLSDLAPTKIELVFYTRRMKTDWRFLFNFLIKQIFKDSNYLTKQLLMVDNKDLELAFFSDSLLIFPISQYSYLTFT